ncbi:glucosamine-6-phosphate deaminase [Amphibacillus marinus]|uniref:Glucosamine-6-phosphate deaminase n=1 Tax=Amphibacillus marinus TaxID=872970 RepID=A0A1H8QR68_9BACI|nr:glucosamine-6-phosphate deaminase [Amphibacillus marinus]SEO56461.1 glucosamine-6-phosphate deaminase [Amphibacillus marinus]
MRLIEKETYQEASIAASQLLINLVTQEQDPVIGLATGSTPEGLYKQLVANYQAGNVSFTSVKTFNLDEYVGLGPEHPNSYYYYMAQKLFNQININQTQTHLPNGQAVDLASECKVYEHLIANAGGIDLQILGLGGNGHIGFNEPGTSFQSNTHVVQLDASTRAANARFFESEAAVPAQAITMGINTIMKSKEILLIVTGNGKAKALKQLLNQEKNEQFPASVLHEHGNVTIIADQAALSEMK